MLIAADRYYHPIMNVLNTPVHFTIATCILLGTLLGSASRGLADASIPVNQVVSQLRRQTQIPIFVPDRLPNSDRIYVSIDASADGYDLSFDLTPDCQGATACRVADLEAQRGQDFYRQPDSETVTLSHNTSAVYTLIRGPYYTAQVEWQYQGVLYRAAVKNGRKEDAIDLANRALEAGVRTATATPTGTLTSSNPQAAINIRDTASTQATVRHIGYAGDRVEILQQQVGDDRYTWYQVRFVQSGAIGWVRGDFIRL